jgi:hypothetical protein
LHAPENDVGATSYHTSPFSEKERGKGKRFFVLIGETCHWCEGKLLGWSVVERLVVAQAKQACLQEAEESLCEHVAG